MLLFFNYLFVNILTIFQTYTIEENVTKSIQNIKAIENVSLAPVTSLPVPKIKAAKMDANPDIQGVEIPLPVVSQYF